MTHLQLPRFVIDMLLNDRPLYVIEDKARDYGWDGVLLTDNQPTIENGTSGGAVTTIPSYTPTSRQLRMLLNVEDGHDPARGMQLPCPVRDDMIDVLVRTGYLERLPNTHRLTVQGRQTIDQEMP